MHPLSFFTRCVSFTFAGPIDGYWALYKQHKTEAVFKILAQYKIGKLDPADVRVVDESDPYAKEPERSPLLRVHKSEPFNAETIVQLIPEHFLTPNELWYVRHHHPVPTIDEEEFKVEIESNNGTVLHLSVDDLKTMFPKVSCQVVIHLLLFTVEVSCIRALTGVLLPNIAGRDCHHPAMRWQPKENIRRVRANPGSEVGRRCHQHGQVGRRVAV